VLKIWNLKKATKKLDAVAHTCNHSYLASGDQENCSFRPFPGKKLARLPSQTISWVRWYTLVILAKRINV
jgi:hypothetical protein